MKLIIHSLLLGAVTLSTACTSYRKTFDKEEYSRCFTDTKIEELEFNNNETHICVIYTGRKTTSTKSLPKSNYKRLKTVLFQYDTEMAQYDLQENRYALFSVTPGDFMLQGIQRLGRDGRTITKNRTDLSSNAGDVYVFWFYADSTARKDGYLRHSYSKLTPSKAIELLNDIKADPNFGGALNPMKYATPTEWQTLCDKKVKTEQTKRIAEIKEDQIKLNKELSATEDNKNSHEFLISNDKIEEQENDKASAIVETAKAMNQNTTKPKKDKTAVVIDKNDPLRKEYPWLFDE